MTKVVEVFVFYFANEFPPSHPTQTVLESNSNEKSEQLEKNFLLFDETNFAIKL